MTTPEERMGRVRQGSRRKRDLEAVEPTPWDEPYPRWLRWARRELPDEFPPFVAMAALMLERRDGEVNAEALLERLRSQGRDVGSLNARRAERGEKPLGEHRSIPIERFYPGRVHEALREHRAREAQENAA